MPPTHDHPAEAAPHPPTRPLLTSRSLAVPHPPAVVLECFELAPHRIPVEAHGRHRILVPSEGDPLRAVVRREGAPTDAVLGPGDMAVARAGTAEARSWDEPMRAIVLWIDPEAADRFATERLHLALAATRLDGVLVVHHPELSALARSMLAVIERGGLGAEVMFDAMATQFLATVARDFGESDPAALAGSLSAERFRRIEALVGDHMGRRIAVAEIARAAGLSPTALPRGLKAGLGLTPLRLVARPRARRARELVEAGERSLAQIAADCGYADQAHPTRSLERAFGRPPGAWRAASRATAGSSGAISAGVMPGRRWGS